LDTLSHLHAFAGLLRITARTVHHRFPRSFRLGFLPHLPLPSRAFPFTFHATFTHTFRFRWYRSRFTHHWTFTTCYAHVYHSHRPLPTPPLPFFRSFTHTACTRHHVAVPVLAFSLLPRFHAFTAYTRYCHFTATRHCVYHTISSHTHCKFPSPRPRLRHSDFGLPGLAFSAVTHHTTVYASSTCAGLRTLYVTRFALHCLRICIFWLFHTPFHWLPFYPWFSLLVFADLPVLRSLFTRFAVSPVHFSRCRILNAPACLTHATRTPSTFAALSPSGFHTARFTLSPRLYHVLRATFLTTCRTRSPHHTHSFRLICLPLRYTLHSAVYRFVRWVSVLPGSPFTYTRLPCRYRHASHAGSAHTTARPFLRISVYGRYLLVTHIHLRIPPLHCTAPYFSPLPHHTLPHTRFLHAHLPVLLFFTVWTSRHWVACFACILPHLHRWCFCLYTIGQVRAAGFLPPAFAVLLRHHRFHADFAFACPSPSTIRLHAAHRTLHFLLRYHLPLRLCVHTRWFTTFPVYLVRCHTLHTSHGSFGSRFSGHFTVTILLRSLSHGHHYLVPSTVSPRTTHTSTPTKRHAAAFSVHSTTGLVLDISTSYVLPLVTHFALLAHFFCWITGYCHWDTPQVAGFYLRGRLRAPPAGHFISLFSYCAAVCAGLVGLCPLRATHTVRTGLRLRRSTRTGSFAHIYTRLFLRGCRAHFGYIPPLLPLKVLPLRRISLHDLTFTTPRFVTVYAHYTHARGCRHLRCRSLRFWFTTTTSPHLVLTRLCNLVRTHTSHAPAHAVAAPGSHPANTVPTTAPLRTHATPTRFYAAHTPSATFTYQFTFSVSRLFVAALLPLRIFSGPCTVCCACLRSPRRTHTKRLTSRGLRTTRRFQGPLHTFTRFAVAAPLRTRAAVNRPLGLRTPLRFSFIRLPHHAPRHRCFVLFAAVLHVPAVHVCRVHYTHATPGYTSHMPGFPVPRVLRLPFHLRHVLAAFVPCVYLSRFDLPVVTRFWFSGFHFTVTPFHTRGTRASPLHICPHLDAVHVHSTPYGLDGSYHAPWFVRSPLRLPGSCCRTPATFASLRCTHGFTIYHTAPLRGRCTWTPHCRLRGCSPHGYRHTFLQRTTAPRTRLRTIFPAPRAHATTTTLARTTVGPSGLCGHRFCLDTTHLSHTLPVHRYCLYLLLVHLFTPAALLRGQDASPHRFLYCVPHQDGITPLHFLSFLIHYALRMDHANGPPFPVLHMGCIRARTLRRCVGWFSRRCRFRTHLCGHALPPSSALRLVPVATWFFSYVAFGRPPHHTSPATLFCIPAVPV